MSTTRKSENTNRIFLSVIFNDGTNSVSNSVGIYRQIYSIGEMVGIYQRNYSIGIYRPSLRRSRNLFLKVATTWWRRFFQTILSIEISRDSNLDSHSATWHFHRWNDQWKVSIGDSIGKSQYMLTLPTLSSSVSPSFSPSHLSPLPSPLSPPLPNYNQTSIPTLPSSQHKHSSFLYFCTWSQHPLILVDFIIFCK